MNCECISKHIAFLTQSSRQLAVLIWLPLFSAAIWPQHWLCSQLAFVCFRLSQYIPAGNLITLHEHMSSTHKVNCMCEICAQTYNYYSNHKLAFFIVVTCFQYSIYIRHSCKLYSKHKLPVYWFRILTAELTTFNLKSWKMCLVIYI